MIQSVPFEWQKTTTRKETFSLLQKVATLDSMLNVTRFKTRKQALNYCTINTNSRAMVNQSLNLQDI